MTYTVDVDTGGTMTDGLIAGEGQLLTVKVDTTPHDLTVSFCEVLREAARRLGFGADLRAFLDEVALIRWSSTITSNVLGEQRGAKVGLLVRQGHERDLYGEGASPAVGTLVAEHNVIGLPSDADEQDVLRAVRTLFEDGTRRICVALDAFGETARERAAKQAIESQYPDHFLGAVPVLLANEMAQVADDATRTHACLINAYVHSALATALFTAEDLLRYDEGWTGPLLIGHTNGGVARVGKTKAVDTIESGPVFGTYASAWWARREGLADVVCLDVGGTTAKASVLRGGEPLTTRDSDLFGVALRTPLTLLLSAVLGGGSVARPGGDGGVRLGPDSMGAAPGPACYGLGGDQATVTDAFVVLGYLDPQTFMGGRRALDVEAARAALQRRLAEPLGIGVEQAALAVADAAVRIVSELVGSTLQRARVSTDGVQLFAYGGNGGLFAALVAERLGITEARVFALGPVMAAFGSAVSDVVHVYERSLPGGGSEAVQLTVADLQQAARRDLAGEGFDPASAALDVELDVRSNGSSWTVRSNGDVGGAAPVDRSLADAGGATVDVVRVRARRALATVEPVAAPPRGGAEAARTRRLVLADGEAADAPVHDWTALRPGARVTGPAVATGGTMTCLVPHGWQLEIDDLGDGRLRHVAVAS